MKLFELFATLSLQSDAFNRGIASAKTLALNAASSIGNTLGNAVRGVASWAAEMVKMGVAYNIQMENYQANFKVLLQSESRAIAMTKQLEQMARSTPFTMKDMADATQSLLTYQVKAEDVTEVLSELGDIALGDKNRLSTLATVFGQINTAGKLMQQDFKQLLGVGFNPLIYIAQKTGETMDQLSARMSKGAVTAAEVAEAFKIATSEGNTFYKGSETASKTLSGQLSTLQGNWEAFWGEIMSPVNDELTGTVVPALINKLGELSDALFGVEEESKALFTDESGNAFSPAAKINEWYDDLIKEWTDGKREDDATVKAFADSFKANTKLIADAYRSRLDDTTLSETERADYEAKIARIEELNTAVEDLLTKRQNGYFTEEDKQNLQAYRKELELLEQSLGTQTEAEKALTPWQSFVHELGVLVAGEGGVIDSIGDMIIAFVQNGGLETVLEGMNTFIQGLSDGTFQAALQGFISDLGDIVDALAKIAGFVGEVIDVGTGIVEHPLITPTSKDLGEDTLWEIEQYASSSEGVNLADAYKSNYGFGSSDVLRLKDVEAILLDLGVFSQMLEGLSESDLSFVMSMLPTIEKVASGTQSGGNLIDVFDVEKYLNSYFNANSIDDEWFNESLASGLSENFGINAGDVTVTEGDITVKIDGKDVAFQIIRDPVFINEIAVAIDQRTNKITAGRGQAR